MTRKPRTPEATSDSERSYVNSPRQGQSEPGLAGATCLKRDESRSSELPARIEAKIAFEPNTGCWLWLGFVDPKTGYGQVKHENRTQSAHAVVYGLLAGEVPEGLELDHSCRQRSCVNPRHLKAVTHRENQRRNLGFAGHNARKTHCKRGHEFTPANTRAHGDGNRACKACEKLRGLGLTRSAQTASPESRLSQPIGLSHPAITPPPPEFRGPLVGGRRVAVARSPYASRAERRGQLPELVEFLKRTKAEVLDGRSLVENVGDGTLWGWRAREALSNCLGVPLAVWDTENGRTQLERLALVERVLAELGFVHRGGWTVGGSR